LNEGIFSRSIGNKEEATNPPEPERIVTSMPSELKVYVLYIMVNNYNAISEQ
jgi:hypothetical protein